MSREGNMEILQGNMHENVPPKEPLSNEEMGNLLSSIGNSEAKALTAGEMKEKVIYSETDLVNLVNGMQGVTPGWKVDRGAPWHWCGHSFEPIGLVAREITDEMSRKYGYEKTEYGTEQGDPLAGILLDFSLRHPETSLYKINGSTLSSSESERHDITVEGESVEFRKRAAVTRLKILWELATRDLPIRQADLSVAVGENPTTLRGILVSLAESGIINYTAIEGQRPFVAYKLKLQQSGYPIPHRKNEFTLTNQVIEAMNILGDEWATLKDIEEEIIKDDIFLKERPKRFHTALRSRISSILKELKLTGFAESENFQGKDRSRIDLSEEQRILIVEYVELLDKFQRRDPEILCKGKQLLVGLTPEDKAYLMKKAQDNSPFGSNRTSYETTKPLVLGLVETNPNSSYKQISELLKEKYGKRLGDGGIARVLLRMQDEGLIDSSIDGRTKRWSIKDSSVAT